MNHTENTASSIVMKACLLRRCLAIDILLLRGADHIENTAILLRVGTCLWSRCLAMRHTIFQYIVMDLLKAQLGSSPVGMF
jgi:hypothetical protein